MEYVTVGHAEYDMVRQPQTMHSNVGLEATTDPIRLTGHYLRKVHLEEDTCGTHYTKYGGIGAAKINGSKGTRTHRHHRTGVDPEIPCPATEQGRLSAVRHNKSFYAQPVNDRATDIFTAAQKIHRAKLTPRVQKAIFPRSVVYEVEYIKEQYRQQMMAALEKERARFEREMNIVGKPTGDQQRGEGAPSTKQDGTSTQPPDDAWKIKPPFWYDSKGERKYRDTNPDDYTVTRLPEPQAKSTLLEEIGMESEERYIPGEIYKDAKPDVNKLTDTHGGTGVWEPRDPGFYRSFDPSTVPRRTDMQRDVALGSSATPVSAQDTAEDEELPEEATAAKMTEDQEESTTAAMRQKTEYVGGDHGGLGEDAVSWPEPPRYLHPWGEERARQFFLTGLPFRAEATRWAERNLPAFEGRFTKRSGKKTFFGLK